MKVVWSRPAAEDLASLHAYIAADSLLYADDFVERLMKAVKRLQDFPYLGRHVPERPTAHNLREIIFHDYRIPYRIETNHIVIAAVIHGRRDLTIRRPRWEII